MPAEVILWLFQGLPRTSEMLVKLPSCMRKCGYLYAGMLTKSSRVDHKLGDVIVEETFVFQAGKMPSSGSFSTIQKHISSNRTIFNGFSAADAQVEHDPNCLVTIIRGLDSGHLPAARVSARCRWCRCRLVTNQAGRRLGIYFEFHHKRAFGRFYRSYTHNGL